MHIGIRYACTFLFPLESQQNYFDYKVMADIKKCPGSDFHDWAPKKELFRWLNSHRIYFSSIPVNRISILRLLQFIIFQIKKIFLNSCPFNLHPDFYGVHPDFSGVPPHPDFSRAHFFFLIYKYETQLFSSCHP